jgi:hypothetical protein
MNGSKPGRREEFRQTRCQGLSIPGLTLPDRQYFPPHVPRGTIKPGIAFPVSVELALPERRSGFGNTR